MSETTTKKVAWPTIAAEAREVDADLAPIQVRLDEAAARALVEEAPNEVYEALFCAERAVNEAREVLRRLVRNLGDGEFRKPCSVGGCDDDQENRTGLCYRHRQAAAEKVKWENP